MEESKASSEEKAS
jgi:GTPase